MYSPESVNITLSNFFRAFVCYAESLPLTICDRFNERAICGQRSTLHIFYLEDELEPSINDLDAYYPPLFTVPSCVAHNALSSCFQDLSFHSLRPCRRCRCSPQARCSHNIKPTKCAVHDADNRFLLINRRPFQYRFAKSLRDGFDDNDGYPY